MFIEIGLNIQYSVNLFQDIPYPGRGTGSDTSRNRQLNNSLCCKYGLKGEG